MARYINPFHVIVPNTKAPDNSDISQLFGLPPGVSERQWPEVAKVKMHHILTLSTEGLELPLPKQIAALSIFFARQGGSQATRFGAPFALITSTADDLAGGRISDYTADYEPWWNDEHPFASETRAGLAFDLEVQSAVPRSFIRDVIAGKQAFFGSDYEDDVYDFCNEQSYVGGFPIWSQGDDSPRDANGDPVYFVMMLNGFDKYLEYSPIGTYDSYLFLDKEANPYWVGQR